MRVGINVSFLHSGSGGIRVYVRNLVDALARVDGDTEYVLYSKLPFTSDLIAETSHMQRLLIPPILKERHLPLASSLVLARARVDVVHEQITAPFIVGRPIVVTIHDILHEHYPQFYTPNVLRYIRITTPLTVRRAAAIITDSEFSRQGIIRRYQAPPEKVVVAPLAPDPIYRPIRDPDRLRVVRDRYGAGKRFILFSGALKPTKNLPRVLDAYVRLRRAGAIHHRLVLAGSRAWVIDDLLTVARESGYAEDIVFTGYVPDEDLVALYNAADLFVHPSLFEGFGLPPLEAMACGTAVVTSNTSALPEVVGDAAIMIDPFDVEALATAMARVLDDGDLRADLEARGLARAAQFTWERTARIVHGVYQSIDSLKHHTSLL